MTIAESDFPFLNLMFQNVNTAPANLPMSAPDSKSMYFTMQSQQLMSLLSFFPAARSIDPARPYDVHYLSQSLFHKIDGDDAFRNKHFSNAMKKMPATSCGIILFPGGGQYLYLYVDEAEARKIRSVDDRYMAIALFKGSTFLGFEEAILKKGPTISTLAVIGQTGFYSAGMDIGGYLSFLLAFLGHKQEMGPFREKIYTATGQEVLFAG